MDVSKDKVIALFNDMLTLEERVKDINADKKDSIEAFAKAHGINPKAVKRAFADYKQFLKDQAEFHEIDGDTDQLVDKIVGEG